MAKESAKSTRAIVERRLDAFLRDLPAGARVPTANLVAIMFDTLADPDRSMRQAGADELRHSLHRDVATNGYLGNLASVVWRAMIAEARR